MYPTDIASADDSLPLITAPNHPYSIALALWPMGNTWPQINIQTSADWGHRRNGMPDSDNRGRDKCGRRGQRMYPHHPSDRGWHLVHTPL